MSEILSFLEAHYVHDLDERVEYIKWIQFLDKVYLKIQADKKENESKEIKKPNKTRK